VAEHHQHVLLGVLKFCCSYLHHFLFRGEDQHLLLLFLGAEGEVYLVED
jgi:hypothetical protein